MPLYLYCRFYCLINRIYIWNKKISKVKKLYFFCRFKISFSISICPDSIIIPWNIFFSFLKRHICIEKCPRVDSVSLSAQFQMSLTENRSILRARHRGSPLSRLSRIFLALIKVRRARQWIKRPADFSRRPRLGMPKIKQKKRRHANSF